MARRLAWIGKPVTGRCRAVWILGNSKIKRNRIRFSSPLERLEDGSARVGVLCASCDPDRVAAGVYSSSYEFSGLVEGSAGMGGDFRFRRGAGGTFLSRLGAELS